MDTIRALVRAYGWLAVEVELWSWARTTGEALKVDVVTTALASRGVHGVEELLAAGPASGGLDADDVRELVAFVRASRSNELLAA